MESWGERICGKRGRLWRRRSDEARDSEKIEKHGERKKALYDMHRINSMHERK